MEEVLKFLAITAVIVAGIVTQVKKEAKKNAADKRRVPMPDAPQQSPDYRGDDTYGGFIPKGPDPVVPHTPKKTKKASSSQRSSYTPLKSKETPPEEITNVADETSEFNVRSAEEVRRGIIWSEILRRKY